MVPVHGRLPMLTVTLLCGRALGGGAELPTATDIRLVTNNAAVTFVQGKMGLAPGWGGATRLVHTVGYRRALGRRVITFPTGSFRSPNSTMIAQFAALSVQLLIVKFVSYRFAVDWSKSAVGGRIRYWSFRLCIV